jgi:hypothetical protein
MPMKTHRCSFGLTSATTTPGRPSSQRLARRTGPDQFSASFVAGSDPSFDGMTPAHLAEVRGSAPVVFAADATSMLESGKTLLVVDRVDEPGRFFRVVLAEAWGPENNLRLANMDFAEFANASDADEVFRGFAGQLLRWVGSNR